MESIAIAKRFEGVYTLKMLQKRLGVRKSTVLKIVSLLRKEGFVETSGGGKQPRLYKISPIRIAGEEYNGIYDIINKYSKVKVVEPFKHKIIGRSLSIEETIPITLKENLFRAAIAVLGLFSFVKDWPKLHHFAKEYNVMRRVGALYDVARLCTKTRKMDERTRKSLLKGKDEEKFIIKPLKSKDFKEIEKKWKVYIPFNKSDLMRYKE